MAEISTLVLETRRKKARILAQIADVHARMEALERDDVDGSNEPAIMDCFAQIAQLKNLLTQARLEGDEFVVRLQGHGHDRVFEITQLGEICIYKIAAPKPGDTGKRPEDFFRQYSVDSAHEHSERRLWERRRIERRLLVADLVAVVSVAASVRGSAMPAALPTLVLGDASISPPARRSQQDAAAASALASFTFGEQSMAFELRLRTGGPLRVTCTVGDGSELGDVLGAHMRRLSRSRHALMQHLTALQAAKQHKYQKGDPASEKLLERLWGAVFGPDEPFAAVSARWNDFGFQSDDPSTDFRAMGHLGLLQLIYFAESFPTDVQRLVGCAGAGAAAVGDGVFCSIALRLRKPARSMLTLRILGFTLLGPVGALCAACSRQAAQEYPLATAGINVTHLLVRMLGLSAELLTLPPGDSRLETPLFRLCLHMHDVAEPLHAVFCTVMLTLDKVWIQRGATYMQFPQVLAEVESFVVEALSKQPLRLLDFRARVEALSGLEVPFVPPPSAGPAAAAAAAAASSADS